MGGTSSEPSRRNITWNRTEKPPRIPLLCNNPHSRFGISDREDKGAVDTFGRCDADLWLCNISPCLRRRDMRTLDRTGSLLRKRLHNLCPVPLRTLVLVSRHQVVPLCRRTTYSNSTMNTPSGPATHCWPPQLTCVQSAIIY